MFLSLTKGGRIHDYKQLKEWGVLEKIPDKVCIWVDLGFQGIEKDYPTKKVSISVKRKKGKQLTPLEKDLNRITASLRVLIENTLAGVKRMRCLTDKYRNHREGFEDEICLICSALWNFHLKISHFLTFPFF